MTLTNLYRDMYAISAEVWAEEMGELDSQHPHYEISCPARDITSLSALFGSKVLDTPATIEPIDGELKVCGTTSGSLWSSDSTIRFDSADIKMAYTSDESNYHGIRISVAREVIDLKDAATRRTVLHELHHPNSASGFFYRLKMKWWNLTKKYESRPHETEARATAEGVLSMAMEERSNA